MTNTIDDREEYTEEEASLMRDMLTLKRLYREAEELHRDVDRRCLEALGGTADQRTPLRIEVTQQLHDGYLPSGAAIRKCRFVSFGDGRRSIYQPGEVIAPTPKERKQNRILYLKFRIEMLAPKASMVGWQKESEELARCRAELAELDPPEQPIAPYPQPQPSHHPFASVTFGREEEPKDRSPEMENVSVTEYTKRR